MIKDAKGRKWHMRFRQYRQGWQWEAQCRRHHIGQGCGWDEFFATKALAEDDARRRIQSRGGVEAVIDQVT